MADDFEAVTANAPGGPGPSAPVVGLSRRFLTNEEKLQDLRRHLRLQEERHKKAERIKKSRERQMAAQWLEYDTAQKQAKAEEVKQRLAHLARQENRAAEKKAHKAEASAAGRTTIPSGGSANGGGLPGARSDAEATPAPDSPGGNRAVAASGGVERERSLGSRERSDSEDGGGAHHRKLSPRRVRKKKKKREEVAEKRGLTIGQQLSQQRSIMQEVQEMCPGLNKSASGREILAAGSRNDKKTRDALVKGDLGALQQVEKEAKEMTSEEEHEEEERQEQPNVSHKHMARRCRLRMMQQIQSQVLQCRKKMAVNFKQSLMSPRGLGCSPHVDVEGFPRGPMTNQWLLE